MLKNNLLPFCLVFNFLCGNNFINAAPSQYCSSQLNTSDCAMPPIPVFTYYKPGSRCEIELWRGCTTLNKFDTEYECSHYCIGKLSPTFSAEVDNQIASLEAMKTGPSTVVSELQLPVLQQIQNCKIPINLEDCDTVEYVYTFNNDVEKCQEVEWKGCETYNKFDDLDSCIEACKGFMENPAEINESETDGSQEDDYEGAAITLATLPDDYEGDGDDSSENADNENDDIGVDNNGRTNDSRGEIEDNSVTDGDNA
ncbi:uncharacterized protein LOC113237517 [Hyposmocoma kahamanoa]|uniref:uncharacterized protein LOC113237517 n=1 Tax=Hyposmocoma kahamanoa TaxID=1477025 RepID=UPI000E6D9C8C|nr:uncharacterized protein LOC113237517 [Hyposmocoma kahamanoa]